MNNNNRIILMIPKQFFTKDFLEIEVKKQLGVQGDTLIQHFKGEMQRLHKKNKRSKLFSPHMFYMCKETDTAVILTGSKQ